MSCMKVVVVKPAKTNRTGSAPTRRSSNGSGKGTTSSATRGSAGRRGGIAVDCLMCKDLERAFEYRRSKYIEARSAADYRVSPELAAYKNVDMERAKSDLQEHLLVCVSAASGPRASRLDSTLGRHAGD